MSLQNGIVVGLSVTALLGYLMALWNRSRIAHCVVIAAVASLSVQALQCERIKVKAAAVRQPPTPADIVLGAIKKQMERNNGR